MRSSPYSRLLVLLDGTERGERALAWVRHLARAVGWLGVGRGGPCAVFAAGIALSLAWWDVRALPQPVVVLFIASSAQAFRLRAPR